MILDEINKAELEIHYKNLINDPKFEKLSQLIRKPNVFDILDVMRYELKHSNFLAWLLNPKETHGLGIIFLTKFLHEILIDKRADISIFDISSEILDNAKIYREKFNIDILIEITTETKSIAIVVENKILSPETNKQLSRYLAKSKEQFPNSSIVYVFLNPKGYESSQNDSYINISYALIINILENILKHQKEYIYPSILNYISDYLNSIRINIMENHEINELARKLYYEHEQILNILFNYKPDVLYEFGDALKERIKLKGWLLGTQQKGYVQFLTPKLNQLIPKGFSSRWSQKESFSIVLEFYSKKKMRLAATIINDDTECANILKPAILSIQGSKETKADYFLSYYVEETSLNVDKIVKEGIDEIENKINEIMPLIESFAVKVENAIICKEKELKELNDKRKHKKFW